MPKENIERAITKGSGADADASSFETVVYEGYGPEGVAVLVEAVTDNRNRTASEVRHAFTKHGGNLGTTGAVAWQFERRGVVLVASDGADEDALVLTAAEAGADDVELDGSSFVVTCAPESLSEVRRALADAGFSVESVELAMVPKTTVAVSDESDRAADRQAGRGPRGDRGRAGRLRELRHPRGRPRSGSLLGGPVAIVAANTVGRRADRIESLLSARLFVEPQLADDRITFVSNLSGHLSLYAMDASGGVPEPLLPPQMALQNPDLVGGELFHVLPGLGLILVMIDADGDENYVPHVDPARGWLSRAAGGRDVRGWSVAPGRGRRRCRDRLLLGRVAGGVRGARGACPPPDEGRRGDLGEPVRRVRGGVDAGPLARRARRRLHDGRRRALRGRRGRQPPDALRDADRGARSRDGAPAERVPVRRTGSRAERASCSRRRSTTTRALSHSSTFHGRARSSRSRSPASLHDGVGELEGLEHLDGDRYSLTYNIDGCSWAYAGTFDEAARSFTVDRVLVGEGELAGGVLHGLHYDRGSGRFVAAFCTATSPTQIHVLPAEDVVADDVDARTGARPGAGAAVGRRGCVVRVARRPARLGAALPAVTRARVRGCAAARLLRARRPAEPGTPGLRLVLDAAHPDPHARGLRRLRPERAWLDRLRAGLLEAGRPRLGRARPPRPRPRDDRGAAERRPRRHRAGRCRGSLLRRLHDADARGPSSRALAWRDRHVRPVRPLHVHGSDPRDVEAVLRARGRRPGEGSRTS